MGFPGGSVVKNSPAMQEMQEIQVQFLGREDPLEEKIAPTPVFLLENSHGQRSLMGYSPWCQKESDRTEQPNNTAHGPLCEMSVRGKSMETKSSLVVSWG